MNSDFILLYSVGGNEGYGITYTALNVREGVCPIITINFERTQNTKKKKGGGKQGGNIMNECEDDRGIITLGAMRWEVPD
jgi:hypothetical protein